MALAAVYGTFRALQVKRDSPELLVNEPGIFCLQPVLHDAETLRKGVVLVQTENSMILSFSDII